jgi:hypothetical protein
MSDPKAAAFRHNGATDSSEGIECAQAYGDQGDYNRTGSSEGRKLSEPLSLEYLVDIFWDQPLSIPPVNCISLFLQLCPFKFPGLI